jgi:hypothetical protein
MKRSPQTPEMTRFNDALRHVMQVSKPELNALLRDEKAIEGVRQKRGPRPKTLALAPSSSRKD